MDPELGNRDHHSGSYPGALGKYTLPKMFLLISGATIQGEHQRLMASLRPWSEIVAARSAACGLPALPAISLTFDKITDFVGTVRL